MGLLRAALRRGDRGERLLFCGEQRGTAQRLQLAEGIGAKDVHLAGDRPRAVSIGHRLRGDDVDAGKRAERDGKREDRTEGDAEEQPRAHRGSPAEDLREERGKQGHDRRTSGARVDPARDRFKGAFGTMAQLPLLAAADDGAAAAEHSKYSGLRQERRALRRAESRAAILYRGSREVSACPRKRALL